MKVRIIPLVLAKYTGEKGYMTFLSDYGVPILRPFIMWYIEGLEKHVLVDTAIEAADYKNYNPKFKHLDVTPLMSFEEALESVNLTPESVDVVIQTHLHFDHCYNTKKCTNARILVQEEELKFSRNPSPFEGIYPAQLFEGLNFELVRGDQKLLDGVDLLFVPGHSAGGQAVSVETEKGKVVISGLCTINENYYPEKGKLSPMAGGGDTVLPGIMWSAVEAYRSIKKIKAVADIILPPHEPEILNMKSIP